MGDADGLQVFTVFGSRTLIDCGDRPAKFDEAGPAKYDIEFCLTTKCRTEEQDMKRFSVRRSPLFLMAASLFFGGAMMVSGAPLPSTSQQTAPDNTRSNKGDAQKGATTADQQKMNPTDRELARKIRASIMDDKALSTYAHNIKVIAQDGKVTLKGPVRTEKEKADIEAKAAAVAGAGNVTNEIEVAPPKS